MHLGRCCHCSEVVSSSSVSSGSSSSTSSSIASSSSISVSQFNPECDHYCPVLPLRYKLTVKLGNPTECCPAYNGVFILRLQPPDPLLPCVPTYLSDELGYFSPQLPDCAPSVSCRRFILSLGVDALLGSATGLCTSGIGTHTILNAEANWNCLGLNRMTLTGSPGPCGQPFDPDRNSFEVTVEPG